MSNRLPYKLSAIIVGLGVLGLTGCTLYDHRSPNLRFRYDSREDAPAVELRGFELLCRTDHGRSKCRQGVTFGLRATDRGHRVREYKAIVVGPFKIDGPDMEVTAGLHDFRIRPIGPGEPINIRRGDTLPVVNGRSRSRRTALEYALTEEAVRAMAEAREVKVRFMGIEGMSEMYFPPKMRHRLDRFVEFCMTP